MAELNARDTELILTQGVYAYVQDDTKGQISTYVGPIKQSMSPTDKPVQYITETGRFKPCSQSEAVQTNIRVEKGSYVILSNPAADGKQPSLGQATVMPTDKLRYGQSENLPGPLSFPLWPGQTAKVIKGHNLRSNEYLLIRMYDDDAARANWEKSVVKTVPVSAPVHEQTSGLVDQPALSQSQPTQNKTLGIDAVELVTGQLIIVRGTDVSFYIPPTGVEVLAEDDGTYVRGAVTLERLEYSIPLDEDGNKEYRKGPDVVFPTPTQRFYTSGERQRKFRAYELQPTTGIHVKVIADYKDAPDAYGNQVSHRAGDELFITGREQSIYYPCPEHAIISYGGNERSFAVAIPAGEGRYVLDRQSGIIRLVQGPTMLLPDPRREVIVQRALSYKECDLYYPGNNEVRKINQDLRSNDGAGSDGTIGADTDMHLHGLSRPRSADDVV